MFSAKALILAEAVTELAKVKGVMVATAESCTGGLVAAALTALPGASTAVDRGFVTYSNEAKVQMLGVSEQDLIVHGAVSEVVARAMARGAVAYSKAQAAVSITGIAGPGGGSEAKPVGLVHFACAAPDGSVVHVERRFGEIGRDQVREESLCQALTLLRDAFNG
jgi:nicotinamide-nucleotide amidase